MRRANKDGHLNGMFDIHIAVPKMEQEVLEEVQKRLHPLIPKFKYFINVHNYTEDRHACFTGKSATDHDLESPGAMATLKVGNGTARGSYEQAKAIICRSMEILEAQKIYVGNFELEHFLDEQVPDFDAFDMQRDFPGYQRVEPPKAPSHENHVIYRRSLGELPTMDEIKETYARVLSVTPHQAVLFARSPRPSDNDLATLALTFYQDSRKAVLDFGKRLERAQGQLQCSDIITEQVCIVGERPK